VHIVLGHCCYFSIDGLAAVLLGISPAALFMEQEIYLPDRESFSLHAMQ
jgi:hypothetical protein